MEALQCSMLPSNYFKRTKQRAALCYMTGDYFEEGLIKTLLIFNNIIVPLNFVFEKCKMFYIVTAWNVMWCVHSNVIVTIFHLESVYFVPFELCMVWTLIQLGISFGTLTLIHYSHLFFNLFYQMCSWLRRFEWKGWNDPSCWSNLAGK